ncbi:PKD domain-containing protein [Candidatus Peregrinibacteria bacterium]|jgi:PKD repeat protein|nr:PKD domain-containing protein [Candidatus Peregrinibacteria bacterium]MBT4055506.1 PKD domain-containing protein [Candidatus Peregrinibacteria bacterium]
MKKIKKLLLALGISSMLLAGSSLVLEQVPNTAHAGDDICSDISSGFFQCPTDEISFTKYTGELVKISPEGYDPGLTRTGSVREFIQKIVNYALSFLGLVAVLLIIYAGAMYLTAGSNQENSDKAKKTIGYTAAGLLLIMASYAIVNTILTGPFEGDRATEGAVGGLAAEGFNVHTKDIIASAENVVKSYKYLIDGAETLKVLTEDAQKSSLGGSQVYDSGSESAKIFGETSSIPKVSRSSVLQYLNGAKTKLQNLRYQAPTFSSIPVKINFITRYIDQKIDEIESLNKVEYFNADGLTATADKENDAFLWIDKQIDKSGKDIVLYKDDPGSAKHPHGMYDYNGDKKANLYEIWDHIRKELIDGSLVDGENYSIATIMGEMKKEFAGPSDKLEAGGYFDTVSCSAAGTPKVDSEGKVVLDANGNVTWEKGGEPAEGMLAKQYCVLKNVYTEISRLDIFQNTVIPQLYNTLSASFDLLGQEVWNENFIENPSFANEHLVSIIQTEDELVKSIKDIKFVQTKLVASTVEGTSPLIVHFDVLNSQDPSGEAVTEERIAWDLMGDGFNTADTRCYSTFKTPAEADESDGFLNYCVYDRPGLYRATAKILSSNPAEYAAGISTIDIKVRPPDTLIALSASHNGVAEPIWLIDYGKEGEDGYEGVLRTSKDSIKLPLKFAEDPGITFSAKRTADLGGQGDGQTIINYKWDFGDGTSEEGPTKIEVEDKEYDNEGVYTVTLEVVEADGSSARKMFNVVVGSPAAHIKMSPGKKTFNLGETASFDASRSSTDEGKITSYEWELTKKAVTLDSNGDAIVPNDNDTVETYNEEAEKSSEKVFNHKFTETGLYKIELKVTDSLDNTDDIDVSEILVVSQPPVPLFSYTVPDKNTPSEYHFDSSKTYDPDGDIDTDSVIKYKWTIEPNTEDKVTVEGGETSLLKENPIVTFEEAGDYKVTLTVSNDEPNSEEVSLEKTLTIENVLDVKWSKQSGEELTTSTIMLDEEGKAEVTVAFESKRAIAYEVNFGDGETSTGEIEKNGGPTKAFHTYRESGKFNIKVTVYDETDASNDIIRKVFVGNGKSPVAKIKVFINGEEYVGYEEPLMISRADVITFDSSDSKNTDGTGRDLKYVWDFGDGDKSTKRTVFHKFDEVSPTPPGFYWVKLIIYDKDDPTPSLDDLEEGKTEKGDLAKLKINVEPKDPQFSSLQAIPAMGEDLVTPVGVNLSVYGAKDPDGKITQYKWWYYDIENADEELGLQVTQSPTAAITIGTNGEEGEPKTYRFGVAITDNENNTVMSEGADDEDKNQLPQNMIPEQDVTNGPNSVPLAKFSVDRTKVFAGDPVNFSSSSKDKDGKIAEYIWDFKGDGFFNDAGKPEYNKATVSYTYDEKNLNGYKVRLKIVDNEGAEAVSQPISVFIDSNANPPKAAFKHEVIGGKTVQFTNNSEADSEADASIKEYKWDFDIASQFDSADADGDGTKDNDFESDEKNPTFTYDEFGIYQVKLTVKDDKGNVESVTNMVNVTALSGPGSASGGTMGDSLLGTPAGGTSTQDPLTLTGGTTLGGLDAEPGAGIGTSAGAGTTLSGLQAILISNPLPNNQGVVALPGDAGEITFDFSQSNGNIAYYILDKNIYFDTNGDGMKNNDADFKTSLPGQWTTNFEEEWGKIVVKLTVTDLDGNSHSTVQEVTFK